MGQTIANYDHPLKEFYEGAIRETINSEVVAFKILDESDKAWSGKYMKYPFHLKRNTGVGARADGSALPTAGQQGYGSIQVSATYQYGRINISGPTLEAGKHAFAAAMESEMEGVTKDLINDLGRQTWGTGDGRLAQVSTAGASTQTINVYNRFAEPGQPGGRYIFAGMSLDAGPAGAAPTLLSTSLVVSSVAISASPGTTTDVITLTASGFTGSACETYLFNRGAAGNGVEMMGLRALVDVYTQANVWSSNAYYGSLIQGIDRSVNTQWNASILANSGVARVIDGFLVQNAFDQIHIATNMEPELIWGHHSVIRAFLEAVSGDRRYGSPVFDAGYSKLTYNGIPLVKDRQAPFNELLLMTKDTIKMATLSDFQWAQKDGSVLSKVSGYDIYEAYIRAYKNLCINANPKGALFIRDIKVDF